LHFNGFCVKQTVYGFKLMTLPFSPFFSGKAEKKGPSETWPAVKFSIVSRET